MADYIKKSIWLSATSTPTSSMRNSRDASLADSKFEMKTSSAKKGNTHTPSYSDLIHCFPIAKIILHCISQSSTSKTSTTAVDHNHDIFKTASKVVVPITNEFEINQLRAWATVSKIEILSAEAKLITRIVDHALVTL